MRTADFDFELPPELIAQTPAPKRDSSRLLVLRRDSGRTTHLHFKDIASFFVPGDVLVMNDSKVIPARLRAHNAQTSGQFEILLLEEMGRNDWWVMLRPGRRARVGTRMVIQGPGPAIHPHISAVVVETNAEGHRRLHFHGPDNILDLLPSIGEVPLPPYIGRADGVTRQDSDRYQTVYAQHPGSVAAPTAGLHFTAELLRELRESGVQVGFVTLHVGLGTFAPVKAEHVHAHRMHEERFSVSPDTAKLIETARKQGRKVFAAGTTSVRVLESVAKAHHGQVRACSGRTRIFIFPPYRFQIVDALITNFHLPRSTLLMLVSAFADNGGSEGRELVLEAYAEAIKQRYRFFSYGDAMLIL